METIQYCSGKHKSQICNNVFDCKEIANGIVGQKNCQDQYEQFCDNHTVNEYKKQHKRNGEI